MKLNIGTQIYRKIGTQEFFLEPELKTPIKGVLYFDINFSAQIQDFLECTSPCLLVGRVWNTERSTVYNISDKRNLVQRTDSSDTEHDG